MKIKKVLSDAAWFSAILAASVVSVGAITLIVKIYATIIEMAWNLW